VGMAIKRRDTEANMQRTLDQVFTPAEAAKDLKVSLSFLAKARMNGTGPAFIQCGRAIRYTLAALEAYKAAQTRTSTSQYLTATNGVPLVKTEPVPAKRRSRTNEPNFLDQLSPSISIHHRQSSKR
jgi:hypothetical protein